MLKYFKIILYIVILYRIFLVNSLITNKILPYTTSNGMKYWVNIRHFTHNYNIIYYFKVLYQYFTL